MWLRDVPLQEGHGLRQETVQPPGWRGAEVLHPVEPEIGAGLEELRLAGLHRSTRVRHSERAIAGLADDEQWRQALFDAGQVHDKAFLYQAPISEPVGDIPSGSTKLYILYH